MRTHSDKDAFHDFHEKNPHGLLQHLADLSGLDGIWLGLLMGPSYRAWLGPLMLDKPVIAPAVVFT